MSEPPPGAGVPPAGNPERLGLEELTGLQPGLARLMPEIGARMWKAYHAAMAENWPLATWQLKEMNKLFRLSTITRPKYATDIGAYLADEIEPLLGALAAADREAFAAAFHEAVDSANEYHRRWKKPWIRWRLPVDPPPDLDLTPEGRPR